MSESVVFLAFIVLVVIVCVQFVAFYIYIEQSLKEKQLLLDELSRATKAVIAKNAHEYVMTTSIDKVQGDQPTAEPEDIPVDALSDEAFDKAIKQMNK